MVQTNKKKNPHCAKTIVEINETNVEAIVDTGAAQSIITKKCLEDKLGMIIEEPTNIELVDVNGKRKKALGKIRNVEISLGGKCVTKMTLQVTDATSYNLILG